MSDTIYLEQTIEKALLATEAVHRAHIAFDKSDWTSARILVAAGFDLGRQADFFWEIYRIAK